MQKQEIKKIVEAKIKELPKKLNKTNIVEYTQMILDLCMEITEKEDKELIMECMMEEISKRPEYENLPSSPMYRFMGEVLNQQEKRRMVKTTEIGTKINNRHKKVSYNIYDNGSYSVTQLDKKTEETQIITFKSLDAVSRKGVKKMLTFLLSRYNEQNYVPVIHFSINELVERGMYANDKVARREAEKSLRTLQTIQIGGKIKKKNKTIAVRSGVLFYDWEIKNNTVRVCVNENIDLDFIACYYALIPVSIYKLKDVNAFDLAQYIFTQARMNTSKIKETGCFNISIRTIRDYLALPHKEDIEEGKKWKPKQYVVDPILKAVQEIQENKESEFEIQLCSDYTNGNLEEFLDGKMKITFQEELRNDITKIAEKKEKNIYQ